MVLVEGLLSLLAVGIVVMSMGLFAVYRSGNRFGWVLVVIAAAIMAVPAYFASGGG